MALDGHEIDCPLDEQVAPPEPQQHQGIVPTTIKEIRQRNRARAFMVGLTVWLLATCICVIIVLIMQPGDSTSTTRWYIGSFILTSIPSLGASAFTYTVTHWKYFHYVPLQEKAS